VESFKCELHVISVFSGFVVIDKKDSFDISENGMPYIPLNKGIHHVQVWNQKIKKFVIDTTLLIPDSLSHPGKGVLLLANQDSVYQLISENKYENTLFLNRTSRLSFMNYFTKINRYIYDSAAIWTDTFGKNLYLTNVDSIEMVWVIGGRAKFTTYWGDDNSDTTGVETDSLNLKTYLIGKNQVTNALWRDIVGEWYSSDSKFCPQCPVRLYNSTRTESGPDGGYRATYYFFRCLNIKYPGHSFRLPTRNEWDYAARDIYFGVRSQIGLGQDVSFMFGQRVEDYTGNFGQVDSIIQNNSGLCNMYANGHEFISGRGYICLRRNHSANRLAEFRVISGHNDPGYGTFRIVADK
jgi:hypothetical protein